MSYRQALTFPKFRGPNDTGWQDRHTSAIAITNLIVRPVVTLLTGWVEYADQHKAAYDAGIGQDGFLGPAWAELGSNIRRLLNGELGRLDGGTIDSFLCRTLE